MLQAVADGSSQNAHPGNILTFFKHPHTNGPTEGLNNAIQGLIKKAYGYRNKERFKTDIFFHLGGLDLYPSEVRPVEGRSCSAALKSEARSPKPERRPKSEGRRQTRISRITEESAVYTTPKAAEASPSPLPKGRGLG